MTSARAFFFFFGGGGMLFFGVGEGALIALFVI